jgi:uncharacterized protein (UPF0303 family)
VLHQLPEYTIADLEALEPFDLPHLTKDDAYDIGTIGVQVIREWGVSLCIHIVIGDDLVFAVKLANTGKGNDEWLAGKAEVANSLHESSLLVKLRREANGLMQVDTDAPTFRVAGGCIPLFVDGKIAGTITMSGEKDVVDHEAAVETLTRYLATIG